MRKKSWNSKAIIWINWCSLVTYVKTDYCDLQAQTVWSAVKTEGLYLHLNTN